MRFQTAPTAQMSQTPSSAPNESPLFTRLTDLALWLTQRVEKFPRAQRFILGSRLLDNVFACHAQLIRARKVTGVARGEALLQADVYLETLRLQSSAQNRFGSRFASRCYQVIDNRTYTSLE